MWELALAAPHVAAPACTHREHDDGVGDDDEGHKVLCHLIVHNAVCEQPELVVARDSGVLQSKRWTGQLAVSLMPLLSLPRQGGWKIGPCSRYVHPAIKA